MREEGICVSSRAGVESRSAVAIMPVSATERRSLLRRLTRLTRNEDAAEDCLQAAFVRLEEYRRHTPVDNVMGMLSRTARNIAIDEARKAQVRASPDCSADLLDNYRDESPLPDEVLIARERLCRARAILDALPERTRAAFMMHRFSGLKYREIAEQFGVSVSAIEKHIARAAHALASSVDGDADEGGR